MSQETAFLHAIADEPADDAHRLIFADWCEDHGQPERAAFLRAQIRAASLQQDDPARDAAEDEADDLLAEHETKWLGPLGDWALEWHWSRGGVERVTVWASTLLEHGEELFALAPIRSLRLLAEAGDMQRLAECSFLRRIETLDLGAEDDPSSPFRGTWHRDRALGALLASPHLTNLHSLKLAGQGIEGPLIHMLVSSGLLDRLIRLDLHSARAFGNGALRSLASAGASRLEALDLRWSNVTALGLRELVNSRKLPRFQNLQVNFSLLFPQRLNSEAIERESAILQRLTWLDSKSDLLEGTILLPLLQALRPEHLAHLRLQSIRLDAQQMESLAACPTLSWLRSLHLDSMHLRDRGTQALADSLILGQLRELSLGGNSIGGPGIRSLMKAPTLTRLRVLNLSGNYVGVPGVETITATDRPRRLEELDLSDCNLDAQCARILAGSTALSRLRVLRLGSNHLGDDGVKAIACSPHLRRLRELNLDSNGIDSPGAQALLESPYLKRIVRLGLHNAMLGERERDQLKARFGEGTKF